MSRFAQRLMLGTSPVSPPPPPVENAPAATQGPAAAVPDSPEIGFGGRLPLSERQGVFRAPALPPGPAADFWELAGRISDEALYVDNSLARNAARDATAKRMIRQVYEATGVELAHPLADGVANAGDSLWTLFGAVDDRRVIETPIDAAVLEFDRQIEELRLKYPDKRGALPEGSLADETLAFQREIFGAAESARQRYDGWVDPIFAELGGGMAGSFGDPLQLATLPVGFGSRTIVGAAMKEAALNMGITAGLEVIRDKAAWADVTGRAYTAEDLFSRIGTAGAFGGLLGGGGKFGQQATGRLFFDRSSFEVFRKTYDALPPDHPFRRAETQRAIDVLARGFREEAERPAGTDADADAANRSEAAIAAAGEDPPPAPDPVRDELVALLDRRASAEEIWQSQAARAAAEGDANQGATLKPGEAIPEGRTYRLPDAEGVPRAGDAGAAVDWLIARAADAAGPEGVAREKRALFIIGYPGAGKSTFVERFARRMRGAFVDADLAKTIIPEYDGGAGSQRVHNESARLRLEAVAELAARGDNIVFETVGNSAEGVLANVNRLKAQGYDVQLAHVRVDPDEAVRRSWRRWLATGRSIQPQYARMVYGKVEPAFDQLVESGAFSGYIDIDYSGARQDAQIRSLAFRESAGGNDGSGMAGDPGRGELAVGPGRAGAGEARGLPDLEDEVVRIVEAARLAAEGRQPAAPPPTSPGAMFDSTVDPAIARAAEDPTPENLEAASEVLERDLYEQMVRRPPKEPRRLRAFLRAIGGMKDDGGELRQMADIGRGRPDRLVNNRTGLDPDIARVKAWEAGYFYGAEPPELDEFLAVIADDLADLSPRYAEGDLQQVDDWLAWQELQRRVDQDGEIPFPDDVAWSFGSDGARLARADAMGFTIDAYHGTVEDITAFTTTPTYRAGLREDPAIFFAGEPDLASSYATWKDRRNTARLMADPVARRRAKWDAMHAANPERYQEGANVMPVRLRLRNPLVVDAKGAVWSKMWGDAMLAAKRGGHDGIIMKNVDDWGDGMMGREARSGWDKFRGRQRAPRTVYAVFDPANVRSRFAEFDPARDGETNILYSHGAAFAPIAASAADDLAGVDPSDFAAVIRETGYAAYRLPPGTEDARLPKGYAVVWHRSGAYAMSTRHMADRQRAGQASFDRLAWSAGDAPPLPASVAEIQAAARTLLKPGDWGIEDVFEIAPAPKLAPAGAKAMTNKATGEVTLFAGRVTAAEAPGLLLHEIGAHAGIEQMIGVDAWEDLLRTVMSRARKNEGPWRGVLAAIPADTPDALRAEEALGYFLEMNPDLREPWWRKVLAAIRDWAARMLPWLDTEISDAAIVELARGAISQRIRNRSRAPELGLENDARVFGPGQPDDLGFITSAERAIANPPKRFRDAKALSADQWRKLLREGGATNEVFTWQVEPALKALADAGVTGDITRGQMIEAMARHRVRMRMAEQSPHTFGDAPFDPSVPGTPETQYSDYIASGPASHYRQEVIVAEGVDFKSHNWNAKGALGHIRTTRRKAGGQTVLHVEELQSDLHQEGAKHGYRNGQSATREDIRAAEAESTKAAHAYEAWWRINETAPRDPRTAADVASIADATGRERARTLIEVRRRLADIYDIRARPPRAPMESWEEPFVRHALQTAAAEGIDTVTFPTHGTLHGALQNEGTKKFYDERLPNTIARVAKSLGLKVETVRVPLTDRPAKDTAATIAGLNDAISDIERGIRRSRPGELQKLKRLLVDAESGGTEVPAIRLTREAKAELLRGVVAYSQGSPTGRAQPSPPGSPAANPKQPTPSNPKPPAGPPSPALARQRYLDALTKRAMNRLAREWNAFRNGSGERDAGEFLQAVLDYQGQGSGLTRSVDGLRKAIIAASLSEMEALLHHFRAGTAGRRVNKADLDNFVKEMFGEDTKDPAAKALAQATAPVLEKLRQRFNHAGGQIGKLDRWGLPQAHDALAMRRWIHANGGKVAGRAALKQRLYDSLDVTRMRDVHTGKPMSAREVWDALDSVIEDMLTDGWATRTPSRQPATPGMLANQRADHRFLIFKDGETWLAWQREFGQGDPVQAVVAHVERMARDIAAMEILGPNPDASIEWLKQKALHEAGKAAVGNPAALPKRILDRKDPGAYVAGKVKRMDEMWGNYTGAVNVPVNESLARKGAFLRNLLTSATLGSAIVSALPTDPVFQAFARHFAGTGHAQMVRMLARQTKNPREAAQLGLIMDHALATFTDEAKHARELAGGNRSAVLAGQVLAVSGLTPWTRGGRQVFGMGMLADLGNLSAIEWADLPPVWKRTLTRYGLEGPEWSAIRAAAPTTDGFLSIENVRAAYGNELADRVTHMILQETEYAVPSGSLRSRSFMRGTDRAGTLMGELRQSGRMFLSFSATLPMLYGYRLAHQLRNPSIGAKAQGALYFAALAGTLMAGGAIALQLKNLRDGKDLQDMADPKFWQAAFLQGGGLGIYGDFIFGNLNRMDRSLGETIAGPAVGFLSDAQEATLGELQKEDPNLARTVGQLILGNVPGSSLWYLKGAYDRWIEDGYAYLVDPKAEERLRRRAQDLRRSTGQGFWWARGTASPQRGPVMADAPPPR